MAAHYSNRWQDWVNLNRQQKKLYLYSLVYLKAISILLHLFRYQDLHKFLKKRVPLKSNLPSELAISRATKLSGIVESAGRTRLVNASCLRRSLVLWYLLRREGIESNLCFGVRKVADEIIGHAWVEIDGSVINDDQENVEQFVQMNFDGM